MSQNRFENKDDILTKPKSNEIKNNFGLQNQVLI